MAKASTETLLSLEQYAEILGADPRHFQGVYSAAYPWKVDAQDFVYRYSWQDTTHAGWEEMALAVAAAEAKIASAIGFWPAPKYIEEETIPWPRYNPIGLEMGSVSFNAYNTLTRYPTVHCAWKKFLKGGRRKVDEVSLAETITYSDEDLDGFSELATITVSGVDTTGWLPKEIALYATEDTTPTERIRGVHVAFSGTDIVITGNSTLFIDPVQWESVRDGNGVDGDDVTVYLASVNVYREYCSDQGESYAPLILLYQNRSATPLVAFSTGYGLLQPYNKERSIVSLIKATWDTDTSAWVSNDCAASCYGPPDLVQMYYQAGIDTDAQGRMQPLLARAVAALATALITKPVVCHGPPENLQHFWQSTPAEGSVSYSLMSCPWGTRNGALEAYSTLRELFAEGMGTASL